MNTDMINTELSGTVVLAHTTLEAPPQKAENICNGLLQSKPCCHLVFEQRNTQSPNRI